MLQALPLNKAALGHPFKPAPSNAPLTIPQKVHLASDVRALERMEFDNAVALKQQLEEVCTSALPHASLEVIQHRSYLRTQFCTAQELPAVISTAQRAAVG